MQIRIETPNSQTSKAEEIAIIEKLQESFAGTQSYLESLFSKRLVEWVKCQINDDIMPDPMAWWADEYEKVKEQLQECISENSKLEMVVENKGKQIGTLQDQIRDLKESRDRWQNDCGDMGRQASEYYLELDAERTKNEIQAQEIIRLKAKLFDLMDIE